MDCHILMRYSRRSKRRRVRFRLEKSQRKLRYSKKATRRNLASRRRNHVKWKLISRRVLRKMIWSGRRFSMETNRWVSSTSYPTRWCIRMRNQASWGKVSWFKEIRVDFLTSSISLTRLRKSFQVEIWLTITLQARRIRHFSTRFVVNRVWKRITNRHSFTTVWCLWTKTLRAPAQRLWSSVSRRQEKMLQQDRIQRKEKQKKVPIDMTYFIHTKSIKFRLKQL